MYKGGVEFVLEILSSLSLLLRLAVYAEFCWSRDFFSNESL